MKSLRRRSLFLTVPSLLFLAALQDAALATGIRGQLGNPQDVGRLMGQTDDVYVLFASFTQASVVGRGELKEGRFFLEIPEAQTLKLRPYDACDGVLPTAPIRVYQTETVLLYNNRLNRAIGPLIQADTPTDPARVVHWIYSDKTARLLGRCSGLNTRYDLSLKAGWNAVLTVSDRSNGALTYTNLHESLPYWLSNQFKFDNARSVLPAAFFKVQKTLR